MGEVPALALDCCLLQGGVELEPGLAVELASALAAECFALGNDAGFVILALAAFFAPGPGPVAAATAAVPLAFLALGAWV